MTLGLILIATLAAGTGSVWLAALLMRGASRASPIGMQAREAWISAAAGGLLATALLHLLPEALQSTSRPRLMFPVLLGGIVAFFILDTAQLWHRDHEQPRLRGAAWKVLAGDAFHAFGDGLLIATAFVADPRLGASSAIAMLAHEVPHHAGDLAVVQAGGSTTQAATRKVALVNSAAMLGGIAGWSFAARAGQAIPYLLALAAGSFVYVALADLVPQLQRHSGDSRPGAKLAWLLAGIALVASVNSVTHGH